MLIAVDIKNWFSVIHGFICDGHKKRADPQKWSHKFVSNKAESPTMFYNPAKYVWMSLSRRI